MDFPTGYVENATGGAVDNSPRVGVKDCLRRVATAPELMPDAVARAEQEVEKAAVECFGHLSHGTRCMTIAHRVAADRMRVRMIELLQEHHRPPYERDPVPEYDDAADAPSRSRLFNEIETHYLQPIDGNAAVVAGYEPGETT